MEKREIKKKLLNYRKLMARASQLEIAIGIYKGSSAELTKELKECLCLAKKIENAINKEKDIRKKEILIRKYINGDTLEEIAEELCFSSRHIQRLLDQAVMEILL